MLDSYYQLKILISENDTIIINKFFDDLKSALEYADELQKKLNVTVEVMHVMVATVTRKLSVVKPQ